jgi:hypothetical protein
VKCQAAKFHTHLPAWQAAGCSDIVFFFRRGAETHRVGYRDKQTPPRNVSTEQSVRTHKKEVRGQYFIVRNIVMNKIIIYYNIIYFIYK